MAANLLACNACRQCQCLHKELKLQSESRETEQEFLAQNKQNTYGKPEKGAQRYKLCPVQKPKQDEKLLQRMERASFPLGSQLSGERDILLHCKRRGWKLIEETRLCWICLAFRSLTRALSGIKVVLLGTGARLLSQSIPSALADLLDGIPDPRWDPSQTVSLS